MLKLTGATIGAVFALSACATPIANMQIEEAALPESPLSFMFGEWEGSAHGVGRDRKPYDITQTERVGPMLDGDVTVIEGRGYAEDGSVVSMPLQLFLMMRHPTAGRCAAIRVDMQAPSRSS